MDLTASFEQAARELVREAEFAGVEIVRVRVRRARGSTQLGLTIDRSGGVGIALCERLAARLEPVLDPLGIPYSLEVESAGLERPLLRPADYERFRGSAVRIRTSIALAGQRTHRGRLVEVRGLAAILATEAGERAIPLAAIASANLEFDPRADLRRDKLKRREQRCRPRR
ncbi:MAG: ribosome maturation factor RimP [Vulcanimicrobiaceae bacterium]